MSDVNCREKMSDLLFHSGVRTYFYINFNEDKWYTEVNSEEYDFIVSEEYDPVEALLHSGRVSDEDRSLLEDFAAKINRAVIMGTENSEMKMQLRLKEQDGEAWHEIRLELEKNAAGKLTEAVGNIHRLTEREVMDRDILHFYTNDRNPAVFASKIDERLRTDLEHDYAFIQFDIVRFKLINDTYGEPLGTQLLNYINDVLRVFCNENQLYCRLSADVFMVVTPYNEIKDIYRFIRALEKRMTGFKGIKYEFAFGVYLVSDRSVPSRTMGDSAGLARAEVKGNALENIGIYNASLKNKLKIKRDIEQRMKFALDNGEFVMFLQPKYSISGNNIIGAEALVRWIHPEKGIIPPNDFIPVFEQNGFIIKLDEYIWECACKLLKKWIDDGYEAVPISVNVSRVHLKNEQFIDYLEKLIEKYNVPKNLIELEITETIENINANTMVQAAKNHGFTLLMDDFGSGYSSLNTLKSTPFDVLKIDRSFLSSFMESERGQKIISHTISMSRDIGLDLIAEGVETREQADFLSGCGCDAAQGFYYSKAVPVDEFEELERKEHTQKATK